MRDKIPKLSKRHTFAPNSIMQGNLQGDSKSNNWFVNWRLREIYGFKSWSLNNRASIPESLKRKERFSKNGWRRKWPPLYNWWLGGILVFLLEAPYHRTPCDCLSLVRIWTDTFISKRSRLHTRVNAHMGWPSSTQCEKRSGALNVGTTSDATASTEHQRFLGFRYANSPHHIPQQDDSPVQILPKDVDS